MEQKYISVILFSYAIHAPHSAIYIRTWMREKMGNKNYMPSSEQIQKPKTPNPFFLSSV